MVAGDKNKGLKQHVAMRGVVLALVATLVLVPALRTAVCAYWYLCVPVSLLLLISCVEISVGEHEDLNKTFDDYVAFWGEESARTGRGSVVHRSAEKMAMRAARHPEMVNLFYSFITDQYQLGFADSFHFGPVLGRESLVETQRRHIQYLCLRLGLDHTMRCLDVGCGVGGPMRNAARFTGARVTGINYSQLQIDKANVINAEQGLGHLCNLVHGNFMDMKDFKENEFDRAFACEATPHAAVKSKLYAEIFRVLKPGAIFASYEWALTDKFDPNNAEHVAMKEGVEYTNALPNLDTVAHILSEYKAAGFEVLDSVDVGDGVPGVQGLFRPWWVHIAPSGGHGALRTAVFTAMARILELFRIAPKGFHRPVQLLAHAAVSMPGGGKLGIWSPCFLVVARKPLH